MDTLKETDATEPRVGVFVSSIKFANDHVINFEEGDVTLIVGPNNSGKSSVLKSVRACLGESQLVTPGTLQVTAQHSGTAKEFSHWIIENIPSFPSSPQPYFSRNGINVALDNVVASWANSSGPLDIYGKWFSLYLKTNDRLNLVEPAQNISFSTTPAHHPIHHLARDDQLEHVVSAEFAKGFGMDLVVHRNAGAQIPLHIGKRPPFDLGEDRVTYSYVQKVEQLPLLQNQGDGVKAFAGILLNLNTGPETVLLIDEPEAFLHPPQAKSLGKIIGKHAHKGRQLFAATHDVSFLTGVLESASKQTKIIRVTRHNGATHAKLLTAEEINIIWADPILKHSNILQGLFHKRVVVCESDSDCHFFSTLLNEIEEKSDGVLNSDLFFTYTSSKQRLHIAVSALKSLGIPVTVVADFDLLAEELDMKRIVESLGGNWNDLRTDWQTVKNDVQERRVALTKEEYRAQVNSILEQQPPGALSKAARKNIGQLLKRDAAWDPAKRNGKEYLSAGETRKAFDQLNLNLKSLGIFILENGEIEAFDKTIDEHGPKWVIDALEHDANTPGVLDSARDFVRAFSFVPELNPDIHSL